MPGRVIIEVHGNEAVGFSLEAVGNRGSTMRPVWPRVADYLRQRTELNIETEGSSTGARWEDLSYEWLSYKFRSGLSLEMMKATEELFEDLTGENAVQDEGDDFMVFGSELPQFAYQMSERQDYPFRPPVDLTEHDEDVITQFIEGWVLGEYNRIGQRTQPGTGRFAAGKGAFG